MPDLSEQQRKAVIAISLIVIACVVALTSWACFAAAMRSIDGEEFPGKLLLTLVGGSQGIFGRSLAGLLLIVSYGATLVAGSKIEDARYFAVVGLSGVGVLATIVLMVLMNDAELSAHVARASETFETVNDYRTAQNIFLSAVLVWLIGTLSTQLGIVANAKQGAN